LREFNSGIGASIEGKKTSSSLSGKNDSEGEEPAFAQEAERKPGRSAGSSRSKSSLRDVSTLKGLVKGVGFAGSSNASGRASFVGFSVFAFLFCLSFLSIIGEGRSLAETRERLPLPLGGVGAERSIKVLMLAVCAVPVCTGSCAAVRAAAARTERSALVDGEGGSVVSVAEG